jgi:arginyl-tRNA synthetase
VKIDDLLDLLIEKASREVASRNPEFSGDDCRLAASQIAVAAIRYFMLKYSRGKLIVFDIEEALSFEGESGPYLQYAVVRANNIFHKLREKEALTEADVIASLGQTPPNFSRRGQPPVGSRLRSLARRCRRAGGAIPGFSVLAKCAFGLAQLFNAFYHRSPILNEERVDRKHGGLPPSPTSARSSRKRSR